MLVSGEPAAWQLNLPENGARLRIEQLLNSLVTVVLQNETRVVILRDAVNDFGVGICGSIRVLLARQRENDSGVLSTRGGKLVGLIPCANFEPRPLPPEVDPRCGLDDIGDIGPANASGDFDKVKPAICVRLQELGMGHAAPQPQPLE